MDRLHCNSCFGFFLVFFYVRLHLNSFKMSKSACFTLSRGFPDYICDMQLSHLNILYMIRVGLRCKPQERGKLVVLPDFAIIFQKPPDDIFWRLIFVQGWHWGFLDKRWSNVWPQTWQTYFISSQMFSFCFIIQQRRLPKRSHQFYFFFKSRRLWIPILHGCSEGRNVEG